MKTLASSNAITLNKTAQPKLALIAEGGGQRGIFTAGVLDAWLQEDYDPFDMFFGTSAGSQNITSYLARQKGYAKRLIRGLSRHKRFFHLGRGLMGKHIVDLDWYFDKTKEANRAIDFETARRTLGQRELYITATNARDRTPHFLSPTGENQQWRELLKASSALPFLYKQGVKLTPWLSTSAANESAATSEQNMTTPKTDYFLDGGLAAPLPVIEAYRRGARKIVVIRTANADFQGQSAWVHKLKSLVCTPGFCPKTIDYLVQHEKAYQQELAFIANPPADVEILQIFAGEKLQSKLLGSTDNDLKHDHKVGIAAGKAFLQQHKTIENNKLTRLMPANKSKGVNEYALSQIDEINNHQGQSDFVVEKRVNQLVARQLTPPQRLSA